MVAPCCVQAANFFFHEHLVEMLEALGGRYKALSRVFYFFLSQSCSYFLERYFLLFSSCKVILIVDRIRCIKAHDIFRSVERSKPNFAAVSQNELLVLFP